MNGRIDLPPTCLPEIRAIYEYWLRKCGDRSMPRRADIDPTEMPPRLLPLLSLVDAVPDDRRYIYRLMGTTEVRVRGFDPTGRSVHDGFLAPDAEDAIACYDRVVATRAPHFDPTAFASDGARYETEETIFLPLSDDGVTVNMILVLACCRDLLEPKAPARPDD